ncbi:hypothetical protein CCR75_005539 [Bremia lactucae]|uniref:RxLR effector protein n=1 Tax=Bremia lactucae TaxID=4779 RepID=A0A976IGP9_BRELC|nr:hypothetical protein CCR75_005539 [Bremia lactucae]
MHIVSVRRVFLATLLITCDATFTISEPQASVTDSTKTANVPQSFDFSSMEKVTSPPNSVPDLSRDESRTATGFVGSINAHAATDTHPIIGGSGPDDVTVTKYHKNGLWQRFKQWWLSLFQGSSDTTRRLREATDYGVVYM